MKILESKRTRIDKDGEEYVDLIGRSFNPQDSTFIKNFRIVQEDEVMRADKLSIFAYGTNRSADILMKFNGIESVFNIQEGDVILIPDLAFIEQFVKRIVEPKKPINFIEVINSSKTSNSKTPTIDKKRVERLEKLAQKFKNPAKNIQVPNMLNEGEKNIEKLDGLLHFK